MAKSKTKSTPKKLSPEDQAKEDISLSTEPNAPQIEDLVNAGKITAVNGLAVLNGTMTLKDAKKAGVSSPQATEPEDAPGDDLDAPAKKGGRKSSISDDMKLIAGDKEVRETSAMGKIKAAFVRATKVGTALPKIVEAFGSLDDKWFQRDPMGYARSYIKDALKAGVIKAA